VFNFYGLFFIVGSSFDSIASVRQALKVSGKCIGGFDKLSHRSTSSATVRQAQPPFDKLSHRSTSSATV
jgi:hypothetical protein